MRLFDHIHYLPINYKQVTGNVSEKTSKEIKAKLMIVEVQTDLIVCDCLIILTTYLTTISK